MELLGLGQVFFVVRNLILSYRERQPESCPAGHSLSAIVEATFDHAHGFVGALSAISVEKNPSRIRSFPVFDLRGLPPVGTGIIESKDFNFWSIGPVTS